MTLKQIPIEPLLVISLAIILAGSAFGLHDLRRLFIGLAMVAIAAIFDLAIHVIRNRSWEIPYAAMVTGLILALIFDTTTHPMLALVAPTLAVLAKNFLAFGRVRHLVNPTAMAMVVLSFFEPVASWWAFGWSGVVVSLVVLLGIYFLWRTRQLPLVATFLVVHLTLVAITSTLPFLVATATDGATLFFATVILTEGYLAPRQSVLRQISMGVCVGIFSGLSGVLSSIPFFHNMDPLLFALVVSNLLLGYFLTPRTILSKDTPLRNYLPTNTPQ